MRGMQKVIMFLFWFGTGILSPVLSLIFLARGCDLHTLPLAMGLYSATVILCEMPTGIFADLFGRKRTFAVSCGFYLAGMILLLLAENFWMILPVAILQGLGRAFSSGSLDALFVEDAVSRKGPEVMPAVTGQISLCQSLGMTLGALTGGVLPMWGRYGAHIALRIVFLAVPALLCMAILQENHPDKEERTGLGGHVRACRGLLVNTPLLWGILACFLSSGALFALVETYWQPAFLSLAGERLRPLMGAVSALGFGAVSLGNLFTQRRKLQPGSAEWKMYFGLRWTLVLATSFLAIQSGVAGFVLGYGVVYLILGGADVLEMTLLNRMVPDGLRASFLSVGSLSLQAGGLMSSLFSAAAVGGLGFRGLFLTGGMILAAGTLVPAVITLSEKRKRNTRSV